MRYLASLRVEAAREALAAGASCVDAAWAAGFSDQAHLTRAFKERLGMTPGFYQRAIACGRACFVARAGAPMKAHALALFTILVWSTTFVAALVWSVYSTLVDRIADAGYETLAATKRIFAWGLLFMMPAVPFAGAFPALGLVDPLVVANLLFLGLGASAACFATWNFAVKHLGAVVTSTYIYLVPALTGAASALVLGEPVTAPIVAGVALTIAGLMLSNRKGSRRGQRRGHASPSSS